MACWLECDVLVLGGGLAGCWAAIAARSEGARVVLMDKAVVGRSGASKYAHQLLAPLPGGALPRWRAELVRAGDFLNDQDWVDNLLQEEGERIADLEQWGVIFERDNDGRLRVNRGRGHLATGIVLCNGHQLMQVMRARVLEAGVQLVERTAALELITGDLCYPSTAPVIGAVGFNPQTQEQVGVLARSVVIATGQIDAKTGVGPINNLTGDGPAMALRVGARLVNMEFCSHKRINLFAGKIYAGFSSLLQGLGARWINADGEAFMEKYTPELKNRSKNGYIVQAFTYEVLMGRGPIYCDMTSFSAETVALLYRLQPTQMKALERMGIDVRKQPVEVAPTVSISSTSGNGGLWIDLNCFTGQEGLFACGAAAKNLAHGTYSVGGMNLAFCNVSGYRAGQAAAGAAQGVNRSESNQIGQSRLDSYLAGLPSCSHGQVQPDDFLKLLHQVIYPAKYSIFRNRSTIKEALNRLQELRQSLASMGAIDAHDLVKSYEIKNIFQLTEAVYHAALLREESRDKHYRADFPFRDDEHWLKWIKIGKDAAGDLVSEIEPVPWEKYPVQPEQTLQVIPYPIPGLKLEQMFN